MTIDLHDYFLSIIFLASIVFILAASEAGRLLGVRAIGRGGDDVSTLEGAILAQDCIASGFDAPDKKALYSCASSHKVTSSS
jgi:hypothetical protein